MAHPTLELRQAVFQAIASARSAAALHHTLSRQGHGADPTIKEQIRRATHAAHTASHHAWAAMIALASRNADAAMSAAKAACEAQTALRLLSQPSSMPECDFLSEMALPDEAALIDMWNDFCGAYAALFSQAEPLDDPVTDSVSVAVLARPARTDRLRRGL